LVVVLVLSPFILFGVWRSGISRDIAALEKKARDAGEPITLEELEASFGPVPDEENAAVALMKIWEEEDSQFWTPFRTGSRPATPMKDELIPSNLLVQAAGGGKQIRPLPWTSEQLSTARGALQKSAERHRRLLRAVQLPKAVFQIHYEEGYNCLLPHLSQIRNEILLLQVRAQLAIRDGDVPSAIEAMSAMIQVAELVREEPILVSQLVRVSCFGLVLDTAAQLLSQVRLRAEDFNALVGLLNGLSAEGSLHRSLLAERVMALSVFSLRVGDLDTIGGGGAMETGPRGIFGRSRLDGFPIGWTGYFAVDRRFMLEHFASVLSQAEHADVGKYLEIASNLRTASTQARRTPYKIVSGMMLPGLAKAGERLVEFEARKRCALIASTVERDRQLQQGQVPASLANLPFQDAGESVDPFSSEPLKIRSIAGGYVIYSIGSDREDNGGDLGRKATPGAAFDIGIEIRALDD